MQRLTIQCEGEWSFDPDPEGEVVNADDAIEIIRTLTAALKMVLQHGRIDDSESRMTQVAAAITKAESTGHL